MLAKNYLNIFSNNSLLIKYEDLDVLTSFHFDKFLVEEEETIQRLLRTIVDNALNLIAAQKRHNLIAP